MYQIDYDIFDINNTNLKEYTILKLHEKRSILFFEDLIIHKTTRKRAKNYLLTIDKSFNKVYKLLYKYHTEKYKFCWFSKNYKKVIKPLINNREKLASFHSIELWNKETKNLAAGEIGVIIGTRYLSMTGFYNENGAGTVLLAFLGKFLKKNGFSFWDLGMDLPYKRDLGARLIDKKEFLKLVKETRDNKINICIDKYEYLDLINEL